GGGGGGRGAEGAVRGLGGGGQVRAEPDLGRLGEHRQVRAPIGGLRHGVPDPAGVDLGAGADWYLAQCDSHAYQRSWRTRDVIGLMSRPLLNRRLEGLGTTIFAEMSARALATGSVNLGQGFPD